MNKNINFKFSYYSKKSKFKLNFLDEQDFSNFMRGLEKEVLR